MAMMRTGESRIWGVFQQTGNNVIAIGSKVGIAFASEPGVVRWTKIIEIAPVALAVDRWPQMRA
jgi:hypothetical protein